MKKTLTMPLEPKHVFRSIAGFKYQLHEAIGDLADNSVDAGCSKIWIYVSRSEVIIADDGKGMDAEEFAKAITPWATAETKAKKNKRGVYGIGLKSAGFSLGRVLEIHTKAKGSHFCAIKLDQEELVDRTDNQFTYDDEETDLFKRFKLSTGTVVRISKINARKVPQQAIDKLRHEVGVMFFRLIERQKLKILINDEKVEAWDPTLPGLKDGAPKNYYHDYGTKTIKIEANDDEGYHSGTIKVHAVHIGRGSHWSNADRMKYRHFLRKKIDPEKEYTTGLLRLDDQGIYLMRNDRLITLGGGWFDIVRSTTLLHHDVCLRVLVETTSDMDHLLGVDHTKTKPDFLPALRDTIRDKYLMEILTDSEERFREEGQVVLKKRQEKASQELKARPSLTRTMGAKTAASGRVATGLFPHKSKEEDDRDENLGRDSKAKESWLELVDKLPYNSMWTGKKNKMDEVILYLAEKHPGYKALYLEHDGDQVRKCLNFLFYNFGIFEADIGRFLPDLKNSERELLETAFKEMRKFVSRQMAEVGDDED